MISEWKGAWVPGAYSEWSQHGTRRDQLGTTRVLSVHRYVDLCRKM